MKNFTTKLATLLVTTTMSTAMLGLSGCSFNLLNPSNSPKESIVNPMINSEELLQKLAKNSWTFSHAVDANQKDITALTKVKDKDGITLTYDINAKNQQKTASFTVGCNNMSGRLRLANNVMNISQVISTRMHCNDLDAAERKLAELMNGNSQLEIAASYPVKLEQTTADGSVIIWQAVLK